MKRKTPQQIARRLREEFGEEWTPKQVEEKIPEIIDTLRRYLGSRGVATPADPELFRQWIYLAERGTEMPGLPAEFEAWLKTPEGIAALKGLGE